MEEPSDSDATDQLREAPEPVDQDADGAVGVVRIGHIRPDGQIDYEPVYLEAVEAERETWGQGGHDKES